MRNALFLSFTVPTCTPRGRQTAVRSPSGASVAATMMVCAGPAKVCNSEEEVRAKLLEAMREAGQHNYSLFMTDDGLVIGYFEAEDMAASIKQLEATDVSQRWEQSMARFFEAGLSDFGSGNILVPEQIFYAS